jgi:glycosyltransferase involved in cell wall biosynthesis
MRVLVVDLLCNSPYYCAPLVRALAAAGAEVELASPEFHLEASALDGVPRPAWLVDLVVHARRPRGLRLAVRSLELSANLLGALRHIAAGAYDVVHVQWIPFEERSTAVMQLLRRACRRGGARLVLTVHNAVPHDRPGPNPDRIRRNLDLADLLVAQTASVADDLARAGARTPVTVIPHGPLFGDQPRPDRTAAATRLGLSPDGPTVLFLGLLRPYKGLDILADAWPAVRAAIPMARLLVVGRLADAGARPDLDRLTALPGVEARERYVSVPEMVDYHAVSDVVVFPYQRTSQSGAFMTAVGLGRPTVVSPIEGLREQAAGIVSAIVAAKATGAAVADAIVTSLRRGEEASRAAERDRVAIAESATGWPAIARATIAAYERPAHGPERAAGAKERGA